MHNPIAWHLNFLAHSKSHFSVSYICPIKLLPLKLFSCRLKHCISACCPFFENVQLLSLKEKLSEKVALPLASKVPWEHNKTMQ